MQLPRNDDYLVPLFQWNGSRRRTSIGFVEAYSSSIRIHLGIRYHACSTHPWFAAFHFSDL
jgi:hypothetical protein